jgi:hypothetical protein
MPADEILRGTNSVERIAVRAVTRHLLDAGAIGAMTTTEPGGRGADEDRRAIQL